LPGTLWLVSICLIVAMTYTINSRVEITSFTNSVTAVKLKYAARSGIYLAVAELSAGRHDTVQATGLSLQYSVDGYPVTVQVMAESFKTPINTASEAQLILSLTGQGFDQATANRIAHQVLDYRDRDSHVHLYGAEDEAYRARGLRYGARDDNFIDLAELKYLGIDDHKTLAGIMQALTLYPATVGRVYTILSKAGVPDSKQVNIIKAIIQLTGNNNQPYRVLDWTYGEA